MQLPMSLEAEEALLGAILLEPKAYLSIAAFLSGEDFFLKRHEYIWTAFSRLQERNDAIDYVTLTRELEAMSVLDEIGGQAYLTSLVNKTPSAVHAEVYGEMVSRTSTRRKMLVAADSHSSDCAGRRAADRQSHQRSGTGAFQCQQQPDQTRVRADLGSSQRLL